MKRILLLWVLLCLSAVVSADDGESWMLMARHGECSPVDVLSRKFPGMGEVTSPDEFVALMRGKKHRVVTRTLGHEGQAVEVNVEAQNLSLIFVRASFCQDMLRGPD